MRHSILSERDSGPLLPSVFDAVRTAFDAVCGSPRPLCLDGAGFVGFPAGRWTVAEVKDLLLSAGCDPATRDAVWAELVRRSRTRGPEWTVACAGVARPMLLREARQLAARVDAASVADVHSAVLEGFLAGLGTLELERPWIVQRLQQRARVRGKATVRGCVAAAAPDDQDLPPAPAGVAGHPDWVLARAVADGVISAGQAELIAATRLEGHSVADYARTRGLSYPACRKARARGERALVTYLAALGEDDGEMAAFLTRSRVRASS